MRPLETISGLADFTGRGPGTDAERRAARWLAGELVGQPPPPGPGRNFLVPAELGAGARLARRAGARGQPSRGWPSDDRSDPARRRADLDRGRRHRRHIARAPPDPRVREPERPRLDPGGRPHRPVRPHQLAGRHTNHNADRHRELRRRPDRPHLPRPAPQSCCASAPTRRRRNARLARMAHDRDGLAHGDCGDPDHRAPRVRRARSDTAAAHGGACARAGAAARGRRLRLRTGRRRQRRRHRGGDRARPRARGGPAQEPRR